MAKFPRVSGNQILRYLQRKGSHTTLQNGDRSTVVPAESKKLKLGTQFSILLYAGIDRDLFINDYEHNLM